MHRNYIGNLVIASPHRYIVYGSVRGLVSEHRTLSAAQRSLERDQRECRSQGGYSDAGVYAWDGERWEMAGMREDL